MDVQGEIMSLSQESLPEWLTIFSLLFLRQTTRLLWREIEGWGWRLGGKSESQKEVMSFGLEPCEAQVMKGWGSFLIHQRAKQIAVRLQ